MKRPRACLGAVATLLAFAALSVPEKAACQGGGALDRVASLTAEGRVSQARSALLEWWDRRWDAADSAERQRGLWLRGILTVDPSIARRDFTRLVLEHPGGPHSADALLRLAQSDAVAGRPLAASRRYEQLLREYPNSPHRLEARRWLDEHREEVARARAERAPSSEPGAEDSAPAEAGPPESGSVTVQLGAFSGLERARVLLRTARSEGIEDLRVVRVDGSGLIRVRAGRFPSREAASDLRSRVEEQGFEAAIVTDADREEPIP